MKFLKGLFYFLAFLYIVACVVLYFAQERIIFLPQKLSKTHKFRAGEEVNIKVAEEVSLNCLHIKAPNSKGIILYLHGNKGHIRRCIGQSQSMAGNGYDIFIPDYRGYGKSDGKMESEQQIYDDLDKIYAYVKRLYPENKIIITGYSLGSGMATYLSQKNKPSQLFLLAPYESLVNIKDRWAWFTPDFLLKYHLPSYKYLADVKCPVTIFHGTADNVIPYENGVALKERFPSIDLVTLQGERHRHTIFNPTFKSTFRQKVK